MSVAFSKRKTYSEMMKISKDFYDTVDFTKFINNDRIDVDDLVDKIEDYYDYKHPELLPKGFDGCFFNFMDNAEFAEYLSGRYGFKVRHEVIERYYLLSD